jgi:hypothetical protein
MKWTILAGICAVLGFGCSAGEPQSASGDEAEAIADFDQAAVVPGSAGFSTRYWDCCKPSCAWKANAAPSAPAHSCSLANQTLANTESQSACSGGSAYACWNFSPWRVSNSLSYGFASASNLPCGTCLRLDFTGKSHGGNPASTQPLAGKRMIVQVVNAGGVASNQVDIMIPGGGVGLFNACARQWGTSDLGAQFGGFLTSCNGNKTCVQNKCNTVFANKPDLLAGCQWFTGWFNGADNPEFTYSEVACPAAIKNRSGM